MIIRNICSRCRHESGVVEIQGGHPGMMPFMFSSMTDRALCMHCGGWAYGVKDDEELPYEFVPTRRRMLRAAAWSAAKIPLLWWGLSLAVILPDATTGAFRILPPWILPILGLAAVLGFAMPWLIGHRAKDSFLINMPHPKGTASPGEFPAFAFLFVPLIVITILVWVYLLKMLAGDVALRSVLIRAAVGAFVSIPTLSAAAYDTFRFGRMPPKGDRVPRFGAEPE